MPIFSFKFKKEGIPDARAIVMANRVLCNSETSPNINFYKEKRKKKLDQVIGNNMHEIVLKAQKDQLSKMYSNYVKLYKDKRADLMEEASEIYSNEISKINNALAIHNSPKIKIKEEDKANAEKPQITKKRGSLIVPRKGAVYFSKKSLSKFQQEQKLIIAQVKEKLEKKFDFGDVSKRNEKEIKKKTLSLNQVIFITYIITKNSKIIQ